MLNESLVKYLAGLLDADGSLSFGFKEDSNRPGRFFVTLRLNLSSSDAVDKAGFVDSLPGVTDMGAVYRYGADKQFTQWYVSKRAHLEMLLPRLLKHMVLKACHWEWLLNEWRGFRGTSISAEERKRLGEDSKQSRKERLGPLKPKNHPTWAWVAGYLDGDGCYTYRRHLIKDTGYWQWTMNVSAVAYVGDALVLEFLHRTFGGKLSPKRETMVEWKRSLGYHNRSFALRFLPRVARHSRLKRHKIDAIIHHHQQRLSVSGPKRRYCEVEGCDRRRHGNGLCVKHYTQERRNGARDSLRASSCS